jgi:cbb3-type cytochrome oxidase subunit 3
MGAMLGGVLEYNSMRFGFSSLYLIAFLLCGLAWVFAFSLKSRPVLADDALAGK